jgi:hypothetical protein
MLSCALTFHRTVAVEGGTHYYHLGIYGRMVLKWLLYDLWVQYSGWEPVNMVINLRVNKRRRSTQRSTYFSHRRSPPDSLQH